VVGQRADGGEQVDHLGAAGLLDRSRRHRLDAGQLALDQLGDRDDGPMNWAQRVTPS
jgi:hypothetical protein